MSTNGHPINFERLLKLRLVVARHGEMDAARWWNTQGMLGGHLRQPGRLHSGRRRGDAQCRLPAGQRHVRDRHRRPRFLAESIPRVAGGPPHRGRTAASQRHRHRERERVLRAGRGRPEHRCVPHLRLRPEYRVRYLLTASRDSPSRRSRSERTRHRHGQGGAFRLQSYS